MTLFEYIQDLFILWGDNPDLWPDEARQSASEALEVSMDKMIDALIEREASGL